MRVVGLLRGEVVATQPTSLKEHRRAGLGWPARVWLRAGPGEVPALAQVPQTQFLGLADVRQPGLVPADAGGQIAPHIDVHKRQPLDRAACRYDDAVP